MGQSCVLTRVKPHRTTHTLRGIRNGENWILSAVQLGVLHQRRVPAVCCAWLQSLSSLGNWGVSMWNSLYHCCNSCECIIILKFKNGFKNTQKTQSNSNKNDGNKEHHCRFLHYMWHGKQYMKVDCDNWKMSIMNPRATTKKKQVNLIIPKI